MLVQHATPSTLEESKINFSLLVAKSPLRISITKVNPLVRGNTISADDVDNTFILLNGVFDRQSTAFRKTNKWLIYIRKVPVYKDELAQEKKAEQAQRADDSERVQTLITLG